MAFGDVLSTYGFCQLNKLERFVSCNTILFYTESKKKHMLSFILCMEQKCITRTEEFQFVCLTKAVRATNIVKCHIFYMINDSTR